MIRNLNWFWYAALFLGWGFDFLFWGKPPGISFAIFYLLCLLTGFGLAWQERHPPAQRALLLLLPMGFFILMSAYRMESLSVFLDGALTLTLMALMAVTFRGGRWLDYGLADLIVKPLELVGSAFSLGYLSRKEMRTQAGAPDRVHQRKQAWAILRGLLLAAPMILIFGALLSSADAIFAQKISTVVDFLQIEKLPEYILRILLILGIAYLLVGIYWHALAKSQEEKLLGQGENALLAPLGFTESVIVLGSVNLLFAAFVLVQFRYFFGGQGNIHLDGFTYAEYARRGFGELLLVALFSLLLYLSLSAITIRTRPSQQRFFSILGMGLVLLVGIILASAFQRLLLYEQAYGFTRLRTYTHVFMVWLGTLLAALVVLELARRLRAFPLTAFLCLLGFAITLNAINVDGLIVRQNVGRLLLDQPPEQPLDVAYLNNLSLDAAPALVQLYQQASLPPELRQKLGGVLFCYQARLQHQKGLPWQSFTFSRLRASNLLHPLEAELNSATYPSESYCDY